ncbi:MAG TPA: DUF4867 family protein [Mobilitalea sp.]|nr:DUF4867 family protein [Mobilitalea sp.]
MKIYNVTDKEFHKYGKVIEGIDLTDLIKAMEKMPIPEGVIYEPSDAGLESLAVAKELQSKAFGELPVQIGYCNGHNVMLNAVEYHRSSELNIAATDAVLLLGCQQDITDDFTYDTSLVEAFLLPKGCGVEIYGTTLHYAPCNANDNGFLVSVVLPKGTNYPLKDKHANGEDKLITANNKWLIAHPESGIENCHVGLKGKNLNVTE